jgi:hypothetical protein
MKLEIIKNVRSLTPGTFLLKLYHFQFESFLIKQNQAGGLMAEPKAFCHKTGHQDSKVNGANLQGGMFITVLS